MDKISEKTTRIIAIDGPAGAGKSTVARRLAETLKISYLDTGAMYRALTLKALRQNIDLNNEEALAALAQKSIIDLADGPSGLKVLLDGEDVSREIRTTEITNKTFYAARAPMVRAIMVRWQRAIGSRKDLVVEGRDIGTVVFPDATNKFYLDADIEERSRRRVKEYEQKGSAVDARQLISELKERDAKDLTRRVGPLKKAADAVFIDTTHFSIDEVVSEMIRYISR